MAALAGCSAALMQLVLARRHKTVTMAAAGGVFHAAAAGVPANRIEQIISDIPKRRIRQQLRR